MTTRRDFIKHLSFLTALGYVGFPKISFADLNTNKRYIFVILRGGMDGLAAVPPYKDRYYVQQRKGIAIPPPSEVDGALDLDKYFGLHPSMQPIYELYQQKEMAVIHAVSSPYRSRSHFDGQDLLENGGIKPGSQHGGWLNRTLKVFGGDQQLGIAISQQVPIVLSGSVTVSSWIPSRRAKARTPFLEQMAELYAKDDMLNKPFSEGIRMRDLAKKSLTKEDINSSRGAVRPGQFAAIARPSAQFLLEEEGPRIATMEIGGWDTHQNQGISSGALANNLGNLANGLRELRDTLQPVWKDTVVTVVTEFGRTVAQNGTNGTDHGTASVAFVLGGKLKGGKKVLGDWPGLSNRALYEGRDLQPVNSMYGIFKAVLRDHLGISINDINRHIFSDSINIKPIRGLIY